MTTKDVIAQAEKGMREEFKDYLFDFTKDYNSALDADIRDTLIEIAVDRFVSKYSSYTKDLRQSVEELIESKMEGAGCDGVKKLCCCDDVLSDIIKEIRE